MSSATLGRRVRRGVPLWAVVAVLVAAFVPLGFVGVSGYLNNFWVYRGFAPPKDPAFVTRKGTFDHFSLNSPALGGRSRPVDVYLPPGYAANPLKRYPVFYLLHGFPGRPGQFFEVGRLGVIEDILLAKHSGQPVILVAPFGSTGTFTDKEWVNGIRPNENWATFLARDVVRAVDHRYRTIRRSSARALGGLSEGGYGALNIGLHNPGEFGVIESWSGYTSADPVTSIFGNRPDLLRANSPLSLLPSVATRLRAAHTFIWFYSTSTDRFSQQNERFAQELARLHVSSHFVLLHGGHNWALWRGKAYDALLAASAHLAHHA